MKQCFECEKTEDQIEIHDHHVVPKSKGGTKTIPLCCECHGLVHEKSRMNIKELTKQALADKRAKGFRTGTVPYGFFAQEDGKLIKNQKEQEVIDIVAALRTQRAYGPKRYTWEKIAAYLNEVEGIYNRAGRPWTKQNTYLVFRNKI